MCISLDEAADRTGQLKRDNRDLGRGQNDGRGASLESERQVPRRGAPSEHLDKAWGDYLAVAGRERERATNRNPRDYPHYTQDGKWHLLPVDALSVWSDGVYEHGNWTAGFWFGIMWLLAVAGDDEAGRLASSRLERLAGRAHDITTHDLGFLFLPSYVFGLSVDRIRQLDAFPAVEAAMTLGRRFNNQGKYIQAFGPIGDSRSSGTSTIDTMMNLPLLWWASKVQGAEPLREIAIQHARTSARLFFRPDGSTYHLNLFDPLSGALINRGTFQGATDGSCWSRGQAWAVTGFAWAFAATGEQEFLETSERAAAYFWAHLPPDGIPPWDFSDSSPTATRDSSAAAVAAVGGLLLGEIHPAGESAQGHRDRASELLSKLALNSLNRTGVDGILLHSCYSKPHGLGIGGSTAWGDFFMGVALGLATGHLQLNEVLGFEPHRAVNAPGLIERKPL